MIPTAFITSWRLTAPWNLSAHVEHELRSGNERDTPYADIQAAGKPLERLRDCFPG